MKDRITLADVASIQILETPKSQHQDSSHAGQNFNEFNNENLPYFKSDYNIPIRNRNQKVEDKVIVRETHSETGDHVIADRRNGFLIQNLLEEITGQEKATEDRGDPMV